VADCMAKVRPPRGARAWKELRSVGTWSREERLIFMMDPKKSPQDRNRNKIDQKCLIRDCRISPSETTKIYFGVSSGRFVIEEPFLFCGQNPQIHDAPRRGTETDRS